MESANTLLNPLDCNISAYQICTDEACLEPVSRRLQTEVGISFFKDLVVFKTDLPRPPTEFFIGGLSPNRLVWSTLPSSFEVCGYEAIQASNATTYMFDFFMMNEELPITFNLSGEFNNTSGESCPITSYRVLAMTEEDETAYSQVSLNDTMLTVTTTNWLRSYDFLIVASTAYNNTATKNYRVNLTDPTPPPSEASQALGNEAPAFGAALPSQIVVEVPG
jgi:hypothetical protein